MAGLSVLEAGQWQGSGAPTARRLRDGATRLAEMVPAENRQVVTLGNAVSGARDGVQNADVLVEQLHAVRAAMAALPAGDLVVSVGGDCAIELAPVEAALSAHRDRLAVVWFDAHADLNSPETSPSGAFHGMVLRALTGDSPDALKPTRALPANRVVLAGARALDPGEQDFVGRHGISHLSVAQLNEPDALLSAVRATGAEAVYIHIDLDVLDPGVFPAVGSPEPGGLTVEALLQAVHALAEEFTPAGVGITEYERADEAGQDEELLQRAVTGIVDAVRN